MANVFLFAPLADALKTDSVAIELSEHTRTVQDLINEQARRGSGWKHNLSAEKLQITVNRQFTDKNAQITHSDEITFIPLSATI